MEPITILPLGVLYQICWYAARTLVALAILGSPVARAVIMYLTRPL
jgi:hypothetical protein